MAFTVKNTIGTARRVSTAGNLTTSLEDEIVGVTDTSSSRTVTLGSEAVQDGNIVIINDESNSASSNGITINTEGSEKIDGSSSTSIGSDSGSLRLYSDGSNWFTF